MMMRLEATLPESYNYLDRTERVGRFEILRFKRVHYYVADPAVYVVDEEIFERYRVVQYVLRKKNGTRTTEWADIHIVHGGSVITEDELMSLVD